MPKKIDEELKARGVRLVSEHQGEYPSLTAAAAAAAANPEGRDRENVSWAVAMPRPRLR